MNLWQLRLSIFGTLAVIIGLSTLFFTVFLWWLDVSFLLLPIFVIAFNLIQWLIAPYLIGMMYRVREVSRSEKPELHEMVDRLSRKSGIEKPQVMIADIPIPNAFAYSSPITGSRVAVTSELLKTLDEEEVEAVLGHELGHLKHRDVQVMMFISILPAIFYYIYISTYFSSMYRRNDRGSSLAIVSVASLVLYFVLTLFTLHLSRLREYFADRHSVSIVEDGSRKLSEGLAKIVNSTHRMKHVRKDANGFSSARARSFKALFISDPERAEADSASLSRAAGYKTDQMLVEETLRKEVTTFGRLAELFSTHPNIVKRLKALQNIS
jgi:heat shock protein HtpX